MPSEPERDAKNLKSRMKRLDIRTTKKRNSQSRQIKDRHPLANGSTGTGTGDIASVAASGSGRGGMPTPGPPMTTPYPTRSSATGSSQTPLPHRTSHPSLPSPPSSFSNPALPSSSSQSHLRPPHRQRSRQHSRKPYQPAPTNPNQQQHQRRYVHSLDRGNQSSPSTDEINNLDPSRRNRGRSKARKTPRHPTSAAFTSAVRESVVNNGETEQAFAEAARSRMVMRSSLLQGIKKNKLHPTLLTHLTLHHYQFRMDEWMEMMLLLPALQELDLDIVSVVSVSVPTFFQEQEPHQSNVMEMEIDPNERVPTSEKRSNSFWRRSRSTSSSASYNSSGHEETMDPREQNQPLSSVFQFHSVLSLTFRGDKILPQLLEFLPNLEVLAFEEAPGAENASSLHESNIDNHNRRQRTQGAQSDSESDSSTLNGCDINSANSPSRASAVFVQLANTILERCPRLCRLVLNDPLMLVSANSDSTDESSLETPRSLVPMHLFQNADNTAGAILAFPHTRRQNHEFEYQRQQEQMWQQQLVQEQIQQDIALLFRAVPKLRSFVSHIRVVSLCPGLLDELVTYHSSHLVSLQILDGRSRRPDMQAPSRPPHHQQQHPHAQQQPYVPSQRQQQQQQQQQLQQQQQQQQQQHHHHHHHHAFYSTDDTYFNPTKLSPPSDSLSLSPSPPPPLLPTSSSPIPILPHAHAHARHTDMPEPPYFPYEVQQQEALLYPQQYFYYETAAISYPLTESPPPESMLPPAPMQYYHLTPFQVHQFQIQSYLLQQQQQQQFMILQQQQQQERQMQHQMHIQALLAKSALHVLESCPALECFEVRIALPLQQIVDSVPSWLCREALQNLQLEIRELVGGAMGRDGDVRGGGGLDPEEEEVMQLFVKSLFMGRRSIHNLQAKESSLSSMSTPSSTCSTPLTGAHSKDRRGGRASSLSPAMAVQSSASGSTSSFDSSISSSSSSLDPVKRKHLSPSLSSSTTTDTCSMGNTSPHPRPSSSSRFRDDPGNDSGSDALITPQPVVGGVSSCQISSVGRLVGLQYLVEHQLTTLPRLEKFSLGNHEYRISPPSSSPSSSHGVRSTNV